MQVLVRRWWLLLLLSSTRVVLTRSSLPSLQTKTYHMSDEEDNVLESAKGTKIEWAGGKNPTVKVHFSPPAWIQPVVHVG